MAVAIPLGVILLLSIFMFSRQNLPLGIAMLAVPMAVLFVATIFYRPGFGFWSAFVANYFVMGISRYLPGPLGLAIDGLLVLTWLSVVFSQFNRQVHWHKASSPITWAALAWFGYAVLELFNPETLSREAWFYAMRGVSLYMLLVVPLVFLLAGEPRHLRFMLRLWAWFTLLGVAKGLMQKIVGPDQWENYWLATVGGKTHLLPEGLRVFSFFTDAATYGSSMGFSGVVFTVLAFQANGRKKIFYLLVALGAFTGMMISGTRGAIAVPFAGFGLAIILSKQVKVMVAGGIVIFTVFALLKLTTVGNGVYEIRRFRGGLDKNNDSFQVRLENQKKLRVYLASRPFGGGIGSAGNWGLRFTPGTFLAETPTDSWYVQIWAEQGVVGLTLHLGILLFVIGWGMYTIWFKIRPPEYKNMSVALVSGMFGVMACSYGSETLGQVPNGLIVYMSMAYVFVIPRWETA